MSEQDEITVSIEARSAELQRNLRRRQFASPILSGGDIDVQWEVVEPWDDEAASTAAPDQNGVDDWGETIGIGYANTETLRFGDKERERDRHRWELDPASAEDYSDRMREGGRRRVSPTD